MRITLYNNKSDNKVVNKSIDPIVSLTGNLREQTSTLELTLSIQAENEEIRNANYLYCDEFQRFYYITDRESKVNGLWILTCRVDVLMSFRQGIYANKGIVKRSGGNGDYYIPDETDVMYQNPHIVYKNFNSFNETEQTLMLITT